MAGTLAKREQVRNFRKWIGDNLPKDQAERAWQLLESIVFISNPNLAGTLFYETRSGAGPPRSADYPKDGLGFYINTDFNRLFVVLQWHGRFYTLDESFGGGASVIGPGAFLPLTAGPDHPLTGDLYLTLATIEPLDADLGNGEAVFWVQEA